MLAGSLAASAEGASALPADSGQAAQAQATQAPAEQKPAPQIAFRLFDDYVQTQQGQLQKDRTASAIASFVLGGLCLGGAAVTYFAGDSIADSLSRERMASGWKIGLSVGLGVGGLAFTYGGINSLVTKPVDLRTKYADVFNEPNPVVQEAMAAATLKDLADASRTKRLINAGRDFALGAIMVTTGILTDSYAGTDLWSGAASYYYWTPISLFTSSLSQFFGTSKEERLYGKYLSVEKALAENKRLYGE
jgi:hypothetical protein